MSRVLLCLLLALVVFALGSGANFHRYPVADTGAQFSRGVGSRPGRNRERRRFRRAGSREIRGCYIAGWRPAGQSRSLHPARRDSDRPARARPGQISPVFRLPSGFAIVKVLAPDELAGIAESQRARQAALRAEGNIRFDVNLSGFSEAAAALANYAKPANWNTDLRNGLRPAAAIVRRFEGPRKEAGRSRGRRLAARLPIPWRCGSAWRRYMPITEKWIRRSPSSKRLSALHLPGRRSYYPR